MIESKTYLLIVVGLKERENKMLFVTQLLDGFSLLPVPWLSNIQSLGSTAAATGVTVLCMRGY